MLRMKVEFLLTLLCFVMLQWLMLGRRGVRDGGRGRVWYGRAGGYSTELGSTARDLRDEMEMARVEKTGHGWRRCAISSRSLVPLKSFLTALT